MLGQSGGRRLLSYEVFARLRTLTHGKLAGHEDLAGPLHHLDQLGTRDFAQSVAGSLGAAHIASNYSGNSLAHLGYGFSRVEVNDSIPVKTFVRLSPAKRWHMDHGASPHFSPPDGRSTP